MERVPQDVRRKEKRELILAGAREVFCKKGFLNVTMQDIISQCSISRGGIYIYYSSVDEIFRELVRSRNKSKFEDIQTSIKNNIRFEDLLEQYFQIQTERLLHLEDGLMRAAYEYYFTHKSEEDIEFHKSQVKRITETVKSILLHGVSQKAVDIEHVHDLSETVMYTIEGLSMQILLNGIQEKDILRQMDFIKSMIRKGL